MIARIIFMSLLAGLSLASTEYSDCTTPTYEDGICIPLKSCNNLFEIFQATPLSAENRKLIRDSKCLTGPDGKPWVCCLKVQPKATTTTAAPFEFEKPCKDPNGAVGICKEVLHCPKLANMLIKRPISPENRQFLKESQCGYSNRIPYVCCANDDEQTPAETTKAPIEEAETAAPEPEWLQVLKEKLPLPPQCGKDAQDRIFGGNETDINEFPWLVLLHFDKPRNRSGYHCGGAIISSRYVLTAAHCLLKIPKPWNLTKVRVGEWNLDSEIDCHRDDDTFCAPKYLDIEIEEKIIYLDYNFKSKEQYFDIALLRLAKELTFNEFVSPICLPLDARLWTKNFAGYTFDVAGWGKTELKTQSNIKLKVNIPFHPTCNKIYNTTEIIETQICAGGVPGQDSCNGDSGGPLMMYNVENMEVPYWLALGVVSFGPSDCGKAGVPGVYTRVSSYLKWISDNMRN